MLFFNQKHYLLKLFFITCHSRYQVSVFVDCSVLQTVTCIKVVSNKKTANFWQKRIIFAVTFFEQVYLSVTHMDQFLWLTLCKLFKILCYLYQLLQKLLQKLSEMASSLAVSNKSYIKHSVSIQSSPSTYNFAFFRIPENP